ncbi:MAG: hypothetical protein DRN95_03860 [Candidatus Hydrothermarchaeota archaeon]|nr:MAG: hypothetical protein DRN88_01415 [Candidatus Hydrothermarchaeota archaeon]RLG58719.1 MAG: hypothetical protein DRN95_03860 [Candidatus Hydrothermarchaeota archaeon]
MRIIMPRKKCKRIVSFVPGTNFFKPAGTPLRTLEIVRMKVEELEAIKLIDYHGYDQEKAAQEMGISRKTLWRDLKSGRKKIAEALIEGKALLIKGGSFIVMQKFKCNDCGLEWRMPFGNALPKVCIKCGGMSIERIE